MFTDRAITGTVNFLERQEQHPAMPLVQELFSVQASFAIRIHPCSACPRCSSCMSYFLFARFSCTIPPIFPSELKCWPMDPSLSRGPPIFCAVPPIAPSAVFGVSVFQEPFDASWRGIRAVEHRSQRPIL